MYFIAFEGEEEQTKTFTQSEVEELIKKRVKNQQTELTEIKQQLASQMEQYNQVAQLSAEERETLEKKIEELNKQTMSAEERARQITEKARKEHEVKVKELEDAVNNWKSRYDNTIVEVAITKAANANKAIRVEQVAAMVKPMVKMIEKLSPEGKPTGTYEPQADFPDTDKDGKPIQMMLTIDEAVKRMTELPAYENLFEGSKVGGLGGSGGTANRGKKIDLAQIARDDPARYRKLRKENPELFQF